MLSMGVPIPWPAQMPSPPQWSYQVLLEEMPCHLRISQHFHHAPAWERAESSDLVTTATWNCVREGQMS